MSRRGRNSPSSTGEETAWANAKCNSGNGVNSSRSTRCRGSSQRATKHRLNNEQWAAIFGESTTNNNIKHDDIMRILDRHASRRKRSSITDQEVEQWIADDEWEAQNAAAMSIANVH